MGGVGGGHRRLAELAVGGLLGLPLAADPQLRAPVVEAFDSKPDKNGFASQKGGGGEQGEGDRNPRPRQPPREVLPLSGGGGGRGERRGPGDLFPWEAI